LRHVVRGTGLLAVRDAAVRDAAVRVTGVRVPGRVAAGVLVEAPDLAGAVCFFGVVLLAAD
jgi:hypothetical protein